MLDQLQLLLMKAMPKKSISRLVGGFARSRWSKSLIPLFVRHYSIDAGQAELTLERYPHLTAFFTRRLKSGLRPIAAGKDIIVSPVDGVVSQLGPITGGSLIQAKGVLYSVSELLGLDYDQARKFNDGTFITIYLSPRDYHRIHVPIDSRVKRSTYIPGTLFPVNPFGVRAVKGLFARNERLVSYLETPAGLVALVKVGATIVGSVKVNYSETTTNVRNSKLTTKDYPQGPTLAKGEELGWFEFGSTVILLFEPGRVSLHVKPGERVLMGQAIGELSE